MSHLNEHKFRQSFEDTISSMSCVHVKWKLKVTNFLLCCHFYSSQRLELFDNLNKINSSFFKLSTKDQVNILLYGYSSNNPISSNEDIIKLVINFLFLIKVGRFNQPLIRFNLQPMNVLYTHTHTHIYIYIYIYIYSSFCLVKKCYL